MKTFRYFLTIISLFFITTAGSAANGIPTEVSTALKSGNSKELAKYFNTNIELAILEKEDVYSKTQAELIVNDFFHL